MDGQNGPFIFKENSWNLIQRIMQILCDSLEFSFFDRYQDLLVPPGRCLDFQAVVTDISNIRNPYLPSHIFKGPPANDCDMDTRKIT